MTFVDIIKVFSLGAGTFLVGSALAPVLLKILAKLGMGKKIREESSAPVFVSMHKAKSGTLTMGGILIWGVTLIVIFTFSLLSAVTDIKIFDDLNFLSRSQTWLPLGALIGAALVGLIDDYINVKGLIPKVGGITVKWKLLIYILIAAIGAWWFYFKLGFDTIHVPFSGDFAIGWLYIPFFIFVVVSTTFAVNEIDGLDGLAGGTVFPALLTYAAIALVQGKADLASFLVVIIGGLLAFLWVNIPPAKVFMGDTGAVALGITLGVVAMLTNYSFLLPVIGFVFVVDTGSVIVQKIYKKIFKKKLFLSSPIHHHFQAKGMLEHTITMKFWIVSWLCAIIGLVVFLLDRTAMK